MSESNLSQPRSLKPVPKKKHIRKKSGAPRDAAVPAPRAGKRQAGRSKAKTVLNPRTHRLKTKSPRNPPADPFKGEPDVEAALPSGIYKPANVEIGTEVSPACNETYSTPWRLTAGKTKAIKILVGAMVFLFFALGLHEAGRLGGFRQAEAARPLRLKPDAKALEAMNKACVHLRAGRGTEAAAILDEVAKRVPDTRSLAYLRALAALQSGDLSEAAGHAKESINRSERESDAMVILSLAEAGDSGSGVLRDAKVVREAKLREAVEADPSNPSPMVELAGILRAGGRNEEALAIMHAAESRLMPVDSHVVVETSIRLMELQSLPESKLPDPVVDGPLPELFSSLYIALRKRRHDIAAEIEAKCRNRSSPELFDYLSGDPAFREFRRNPAGDPAL